MRCHVLAQTNKMNLVHGAEVQDPAGVLGHGQDFVFIRCLGGLLQVVPLSRRTNIDITGSGYGIYFS